MHENDDYSMGKNNFSENGFQYKSTETFP